MAPPTIPVESDDSALAFSIAGSAKQLAVGISTMKLLIANNAVKTIRIGRRRLVLADSLREYVARLASGGES